MDVSKILDTKSSVEIRMFDSNSNKTFCKVLTIRELKQISEILSIDISKRKEFIQYDFR